ncbi:hypothetical protein AYI70_g11024 [Smittium culicis]|uniref:Uncharacterized protein n=1 Tax=Smittium culicis TaxID=133412 RepID=A0A1R1X3Q6_9FUNG|nr:hypothetical protein AYI70_g11024 [Smittium culicis]
MRYRAGGKNRSGGDRAYSDKDVGGQGEECPVVALDMGGAGGGRSGVDDYRAGSISRGKRDESGAELGADIGFSSGTGASLLGAMSSSQMNDVAASLPIQGEPEILGAAVPVAAATAGPLQPRAYSIDELANSDGQGFTVANPTEFASDQAEKAIGNSSIGLGWAEAQATCK